jgi:hypothetical protein
MLLFQSSIVHRTNVEVLNGGKSINVNALTCGKISRNEQHAVRIFLNPSVRKCLKPGMIFFAIGMHVGHSPYLFMS